MIFVKKLYICKKNIMNNAGRKRIEVDSELLLKIADIYKAFFKIDLEIETKNLSQCDKMVLTYHLSDIENVSTASIAELCGYKHHTAVCYHRKKIIEFFNKKSNIRAADFELKFITFNAYFHKNKKSFLCASQ